MLGGAKHYAYLTDEVYNDPKLLAGVAGVFAPLAERTLLHTPRSVEQGALRVVQYPRFNDPPPKEFFCAMLLGGGWCGHTLA